MGTIDARKLNAALAKAKNIGLVEEGCTIGGCDLVLRSLRSEDYAGALQDCDGLPEEEYIARYQKGHIARAIVEINGVDLRDSRYVTVEEPDPSREGATRSVTLEVHQYLLKHMLESWGKEAVDVAFRKLGDVLELAERQAKTGITFLVQEETAEEKYRRLTLEARGLEKDLPGTLLDKILEEQGLMRRSTAEEIKQAMDRTDQLAREQEAEVAPAQETPLAVVPPTAEVVKDVPPQPSSVSPRGAPRPADPHVTLQSVMAARKSPEVTAVQEPEPKPPSPRSAAIANMEGVTAELPDLAAAVSLHGGDPREVVEIKKAPADLQAAPITVDNPPIAGINPRFKPQQRA